MFIFYVNFFYNIYGTLFKYEKLVIQILKGNLYTETKDCLFTFINYIYWSSYSKIYIIINSEIHYKLYATALGK
jgi:hypothetical protein